MNRRAFFRDVLASAALAWGAPLVAMADVAPEAEPVVDRMLTDADIYEALPTIREALPTRPHPNCRCLFVEPGDSLSATAAKMRGANQ